MTQKKLTDKQQRFVEEYLIDLNATQAAIRAGYSEKTAYSIGNENLSKPEISDAIDAGMEKRSQNAQIDAQWVLERSVELYHMCIDQDDVKAAKGALDLVGKHVGVKAFEQAKTEIHIHDDIDNRILSGRKRASETTRTDH